MRYLAIIALALLAGCASNSWVGVDAQQDSLKRLVIDNQKFCSGMVLSAKQGYVLTAAHCVNEGQSILVDGSISSVIKIDTNMDMAIIKVPNLVGQSVTIRPDSPIIGEDVAFMGYGFASLSPLYTYGRVASLGDPSINKGLIIDGTVAGGDSGGMVVDHNGQVISMIRGVYSDAPWAHVVLCVDHANLRSFAEFYN